MNRRSNSREEILDAAEGVVTEFGSGRLTLDAVAERAGISKGGLLYNFPSKEALLRAMLARHLERFDAACEVAGESETEGGKAGAAEDLRAFVRAGFQSGSENSQVSAALLAAGAMDPKLLTPVREWHEAHLRKFSSGKRYPLRVLVLMLAMDGLWLNELLHTSAFGPEMKEQLMAEMLALADTTA